MPGPTVDTCSASVLGGFCTISPLFQREDELGHEAALQVNGEVCTDDASAAFFAELVARGKSDISSTSPLYQAVFCVRCPGFAREEFFQPSMTHSCGSSRARGRREPDSLVFCHT